MEEYSCSIRELQHYMYCPHRWGLIRIDCSWAENYFVTKANILHTRVHDPDRVYTSKQKRVFTSVTVFNDELGLYGVTDCVEVARKGDISHPEEMTIVEYKPRKPKGAEYNPDDLMQVFAQKVCLDRMFKCRVKGLLYYADVKKRIPLPLDENYETYYSDLISLLEEIRKLVREGTIPPIRKNQKCRGCSFQDLCMPKTVHRRIKPFFQQLDELNKEDESDVTGSKTIEETDAKTAEYNLCNQ